MPLAWSVILAVGTLIHSTPHFSSPQIQITLARSQPPSAHPYHGYLDGLISGPLWLALIILSLTTHGDTIPPPWAPQYAGSWIHSKGRCSSLPQRRVRPISLPVPSSLTVPILQLHRLSDGGTFFPF